MQKEYLIMKVNTTGDINSPGRFYSLDALRGIAALGVVLWHWKHFFYLGTAPGPVVWSSLPFYNVLYVFYSKGNLGVELFFTLSGFIFYWLYSKSISEGRLSASKFAILRFSRLYPLHLATLLLVAGCQMIALRSRGSYFAIGNNDPWHFLLNLFLASAWGLQAGESFNWPIWSVSIEVLLYSAFFCCCRWLPVRMPLVASAATAFILMTNYGTSTLIGRGAGSFFMGGCVFMVFECTRKLKQRNLIATISAGMCLALWAVTVYFLYYNVHAKEVNLQATLTSLSPVSAMEYVTAKAVSVWPSAILFPATILALALVESCRGTLGKRLSFLGDISYSSYLLHFPLQITCSMLVRHLSLPNSVYYSLPFMACYFAALLALSVCSYKYFELPAQKLIRNKMMRPQVISSASPSARPA